MISIMINFKKMDEKDFVFVNKSLTQKEEKEFSNFLKTRKLKLKKGLRLNLRPKRELV